MEPKGETSASRLSFSRGLRALARTGSPHPALLGCTSTPCSGRLRPIEQRRRRQDPRAAASGSSDRHRRERQSELRSRPSRASRRRRRPTDTRPRPEGHRKSQGPRSATTAAIQVPSPLDSSRRRRIRSAGQIRRARSMSGPGRSSRMSMRRGQAREGLLPRPSFVFPRSALTGVGADPASRGSTRRTSAECPAGVPVRPTVAAIRYASRPRAGPHWVYARPASASASRVRPARRMRSSWSSNQTPW
jgi:hypothetical protein